VALVSLLVSLSVLLGSPYYSCVHLHTRNSTGNTSEDPNSMVISNGLEQHGDFHKRYIKIPKHLGSEDVLPKHLVFRRRVA
jgi:hypothetical protein